MFVAAAERHADAAVAGIHAPSASACISRSCSSSRLPIALAITALAMGVHALVNQKFVGHLIVIAYWVLFPVLSNLGFDHRLYQVGRPPDFTYSDMAGWGPYLPRILTISYYSVAFCLAARDDRVAGARARHRFVLGRTAEARRAAVASRRCARRGRLRGGRRRARLLVLPQREYAQRLHRGACCRARVKAWEVKYKPLESLPQPRLVGVSLRHDYFPERRAAAVARYAHRGES